jgi:hypothetical protein
MLKKQPLGGCIEGFFQWVFSEVWKFGNILKALYFMHFGKRYESLSGARPNHSSKVAKMMRPAAELG